MIRSFVKTILLPGVIVLSCAATAADDPPVLMHNPFSRPPSLVSVTRAGQPQPDTGSSQTVPLTGTMVSNKDKLANVAGKIIRIGQEVDGFLLVEIHEDYAVFLRAGSKIKVHVKTEITDDEDRREKR